MRSRVLLISLATLALFQAGCDGDGMSETTQATSSTSTTTTSAPTTVNSTATTVGQQPVSELGLFPAGEPVDLLVMTDSSGWGIAERYAPLAANALDREIRVHDWARGGEPITKILEWVQTFLADDVAEAEIIVIYGYPGGLEYDLPEPSLLSCFEAADAVTGPEEYTGDWTPGTKWEPTPVVPVVEDWQPYRDVLDQVYAEIWKLREGKPTIIRTYDVPLGLIAPWEELGIDSECVANWEIQFQVVQEAAEANGGGFVSVYDVFSGPNHDEDPVEKGWMLDDLMHASEEGLDIIADALAAYGFELSEPPKSEATGAAVAFDFQEDSICDWFTAEDVARIVAFAQRASGVEMDFGEDWGCTPDGWSSGIATVGLDRYPSSPATGHFVASAALDKSITRSRLERTKVWHLEGIHVVLRIEGHDDITFRFMADPGSATLDRSQIAALGFKIANAMLREMSWVN